MKMKIKKVNQKQLRLERARLLAEKRKAAEAQYHVEFAAWKECGLQEHFPFEALEEWVERECEEWQEAQLNVPFGKYEDWKKIVAEYQQRFIQYICELCPNVFDELRQFVSLFDELFGEDKEKYNAIFNSNSMEIFELESSLRIKLRHHLLNDKFLEFRANNTYDYDHSNLWAEFEILFALLAFRLVPVDQSDERKQLWNEIVELIRKEVKFRTYLTYLGIESFEKDKLDRFINFKCEDIVQYLLEDKSCKFFFEQADSSVRRFLQETLTESEETYYYNERISSEITEKVEPFIKLQYEILRWERRHAIRKDWLLRYAYYFLSKFSENPQLNVSEIEIHPLRIRSLAASPFEFRFNGWLAGDESKENYECRLIESFENALASYFDGVYTRFELDEKKRITKPLNYDLAKPLVRRTVQKWSYEKIVELDYEILDSISTKEDFTRKVKYLREELPKLKKFDLPFEA